jgi:hypothetical protein
MTNTLDFKYISKWLATMNTLSGFAILDGENAINDKRKKHKYLTNFFADCATMNLRPIIVAKVSDVRRLKKRVPSVEIPDDIIFFFLHGNNNMCPDDAFIIELYSHLVSSGMNAKVFSIDKFSNRKSWAQKLHKTMISYNLVPKRPRCSTDPDVILYHPDLNHIISVKIIDKVVLHADGNDDVAVRSSVGGGEMRGKGGLSAEGGSDDGTDSNTNTQIDTDDSL